MMNVNGLPLVALLLLTAMPSHSAPMTAEFSAKAVCPLYQSKNKQTNPGDHHTQVGQTYAVIEYLGSSDNPSWYRLETSIAPSPQRWVAANCGALTSTTQSASPTAATFTQPLSQSANQPVAASNKRQACSTPEQYDSNLLALSWQNAFCELSGRNKAECTTMLRDASLPAHHNFSLHGLWPNKQGCGINYGYCADVTSKPKHFCDYPALTLSESTRTALESLMPSAQFGTCLQKHEYWKHGSCTTFSQDDYFQQAIRLTTAVNNSSLVRDLLKKRIGQTISRKQFMQAFSQDFGPDASNKVSLQCRNGVLMEIQLSLPKDLTDTSLSQLLAQARPIKPGSCPAQFTIDAPGY
ncbi:ribonuclease T [Shewanella sp. SNU WT4]|uniref:ribonuclease T2 family protein n=1 Tax=Shewanella sp. SNU WT4 TaxID=2590015 RepID=UPI00112817BD|nr:ribonuclease T [Shewanella sp. SNU WT4]QDF65719.1 ribonuclease T [Shewanella sp. SNU WT4]